MAATNPGRTQLEQDLGALIDALDLPPLQKNFLRSRWLDQVIWMESRADSARWWYHLLRPITIISSALIPGLLSALFLITDEKWRASVHVAILVLSVMVAALVGVEEFFHHGERWRHYRRTVEWLKTEGWQFFESCGAYVGKTHTEAYAAFAGRVEEVLQQDIEGFIAHIAGEKEGEKEKLRAI
jgi:Protein of unknown function (DUF4231)